MSKEKSILGKIRKVIMAEDEISLAEMTLEDGTVIFAESFEAGEAVWMLDGEERVPLAVGEYPLADEQILSVTSEGVIDSIAAAEEVSEEDLKAVEKMKKENDELKAQNEELKRDVEVKATKLSKPASKGVKTSPEGKLNLDKVMPTNLELSNMSVKERITHRMQQTPFYNNVKLATTESITTTYAGEFAGQYIGAATLSGVTLGANAITVKPNIKLKEVVKKVATSSILADASCDFSPTGSVTLTESILTPKELQVNLELCKTDFQSDWDAISMGYSAFDQLPPNFQAFFAEQMAGIVNASVETSLWHGVEATTGQFEGLVVKMTADADVVDEAGTTVTASNVIAELGSIVDEIPSTVYNEPDMTIYVAPNIGRAYIRALGGFAASGVGASGTNAQGTQWFNRSNGLTFDGIPIFIANGLTSNYAVAAQASNLWYGTGLLNDNNEVKILDMADIDGSQNVRFVMRFTAGTQYGIGSEIVLYTPA